MSKSNCKNCGDQTTFVTKGDRQADYQREILGWCRRCFKIAHKDEKHFAEVLWAAKRAKGGGAS